MKRTKVKSSNIASVGYEPKALILEIEFNNGSIYQYLRVPKDIYQGLMNSESKGKYFYNHIKTGKYSYRKVN